VTREVVLAMSLALATTHCGKRAVNDGETDRKEGAVPEMKLLQRLSAADVVFVGKPVRLGASPGAWSGRYTSYQEVEYSVTRWLKKHAADAGTERIVVLHVLVQGARTADPEAPRLDASLFATDRSLLVLAKVERGELIALDANDSVAPATDELVAAAERRLAAEPR